MIIDGIRYSASSKNLRPFFDNVIIPYLDSIGMELLFVNNCLITAIANAILRRDLSISEIANIRLNLLPVIGLGELLDAGDIATILIITQTLGIDLDETGLAIHLPGIDAPIIYGEGRKGMGAIVFDAEARHFYSRLCI